MQEIGQTDCICIWYLHVIHWQMTNIHIYWLKTCFREITLYLLFRFVSFFFIVYFDLDIWLELDCWLRNRLNHLNLDNLGHSILFVNITQNYSAPVYLSFCFVFVLCDQFHFASLSFSMQTVFNWMDSKKMDTLQVCSTSTQNLLGGSKPSSRAPSPCRSDQSK